MLVGRLRMAIRPQWWIDASLSKAHRSQAIQMSPLWSLLFAFRSFGPTHETPRLILLPRRSIHHQNSSTERKNHHHHKFGQFDMENTIICCHQPGSTFLYIYIWKRHKPKREHKQMRKKVKKKNDFFSFLIFFIYTPESNFSLIGF